MKRLVYLSLLIVSMTLSGCSVFGNFFAKDNSIPPTPLVNFSPAIPVSSLGTHRLTYGDGGYYLHLSPAIDNGVIYAADYYGKVAAWNINSFQVNWQQQTKFSWATGVGVGADRLFIGTADGRIVALSKANGQVLWIAPVDGQVLAAPVATQGIVLINTIDGRLVALSAINGRQLWSFTQLVPNFVLHMTSQPIVVDQRVVNGFGDGSLAVLIFKTGNPIWVNPVTNPTGRTPVQRIAAITANPIVLNGFIYAVTYQGNIAALSINSGQILWQHTLSAFAGLTADQQNIYVSDADSRVWAFNQQTGHVMWQQSALLGRHITAPVIMQNTLVVADSLGYVHWLSLTDGHFLARTKVGGIFLVTPLVNGNTVYVFGRGGLLTGLKIGR